MQKKTQLSEISVIWKTETDSTNLDAARGKTSYPDKSVWAAEFQTEGRGQRGNIWSSQRAENLLFSILLKPSRIPASRQFILSEAASVAMAIYLSRHGIDSRIKWPNDIYVGDKKICGMLIENSISADKVSVSIIGIGLNVLQRSFPDALPNPTSMVQCMQSSSDLQIREELTKYLSVFYELYDSLEEESERSALDEKYLALLYRKGEWHKYLEMSSDAGGEQRVIEGCIEGVDKKTSRLKLRVPDGTVKLYAFKEICYII